MTTQGTRTVQKACLVVCCIALADSIQACSEDYELEHSICPPGAPVQAALGMPHNGPGALTKEVNDQEVRAVLGRAVSGKVPEATHGVALEVVADAWGANGDKSPVHRLHCYTLKYPSKEARKAFPEALRNKIDEYLRIRLIGHTREYAIAYCRGEPRGDRKAQAAKVALSRSYFLPLSWIQDWKIEGEPAGYMVKDGPLVWTFRFMGGSIWAYVVDAQEFDPELMSKFAAARAKATMRLADRGIHPRLGYVHQYTRELKAVLLEEHKIVWWSVTDLNVGLFD